MDSNTYSVVSPDELQELAAVVDRLAARELDGLADAVRAERVLVLRRLLDRLEGHWLRELAAVDASGAAGAEDGMPAPSTASWVRPQLTVTVDLDSLLGRPDSLGGEAGGDVSGIGPLDPEACRRLACDGAMTRVLVTRHPTSPTGAAGIRPAVIPGPGRDADLEGRLRAATFLLPAVLGGAPTQPLEVGRTTRVVQPAQRAALAVRDGGCGFPGCQRPLAWCEAHHLRHWLHGGPTDLANLVLLCRAHHRAVHEGGWRLQRQPDGRLTAAPPHRRPRSAHRRPRTAV